MEETVKLACRILFVSQSTFFFVLQKITACVMVRVSYKSHNVSNFHSSRSTATKNCLMPSRVNSSRLTRIRMGSDMNLLVISRISWGRVAEMRQTWVAGGRYLYTS